MPTQQPRRNSARAIRWWLEAGAEHCPFCESARHYEVFIRCNTCDRPICPACLVEAFEGREALCPECAAG